MSKSIVAAPLLEQARALAVRYLEGTADRKVGPLVDREALLRSLHTPLPDHGQEPAAVLDALADGAEPGLVASVTARYFGFVIGGSLPVTLAADWLTSAWDQNAGLYVTSPAASVVEDVAREWLLDLFDLPRTAGLGFVTGCQMANFTALAAARHSVLRRAGWNVEENGLAGAPHVNLVVSAESHITIHSAMRFLGFGTKALQPVDSDEQGRMKPAELARLLEHLSGPTIICAQAGNVNTGAFDPLREIAALARQHEAWLHVDGAFGLWARVSGERRAQADGIDLADSWATDAHKWLNVPYDNGIVIVRDSAAHRASMTTTASYLEQSGGAARDPFDWVPEFSRRARGFTVYAALRHLGRSGVEALIDRACRAAHVMADALRQDARVSVLNDVTLNQVLVRFGDSDEVTRSVIARIQQNGALWAAGTTWHGKAALRISVSNWATDDDDARDAAAAILAALA